MCESELDPKPRLRAQGVLTPGLAAGGSRLGLTDRYRAVTYTVFDRYIITVTPTKMAH